MEITLQVDQRFASQIDTAAIETAVTIVVEQHCETHHPTGLSLIITDNSTIQQLNHQYRGVDVPTDVLSFTNDPDPDFPTTSTEAGQNYLGDVIISYPIAKKQAENSGHSPMDEVVLLAVHGALHLLGFDHDTPANKSQMWAAQYQIMEALALGHIQPTENDNA